jgi:mxaK protein
MASRIKPINVLFGIMIAVGAAGASWEAWKVWKIEGLNRDIRAGKTIKDEAYPFHEKFSMAWLQGQNRDFKHAIQTYNQIVESKSFQQLTSKPQQASIQYNIGNNLFTAGLTMGFNDDGSIKEDGKYNFMQARMAYEQALRLDPESRKAKFNLSLLHGVLPLANKSTPKEQSGMELSNLPIGLP